VTDEGSLDACDRFKLVSLKVCSETGETPHAFVVLADGGMEISADESGGGPVDASFRAIEKVVDSGSALLLYSVNNITTGTDAQGEVTVRLTRNGRIVNGQGADTDIVFASVKSYLNALNKLYGAEERAHPQV